MAPATAARSGLRTKDVVIEFPPEQANAVALRRGGVWKRSLKATLTWRPGWSARAAGGRQRAEQPLGRTVGVRRPRRKPDAGEQAPLLRAGAELDRGTVPLGDHLDDREPDPATRAFGAGHAVEAIHHAVALRDGNAGA